MEIFNRTVGYEKLLVADVNFEKGIQKFWNSIFFVRSEVVLELPIVI